MFLRAVLSSLSLRMGTAAALATLALGVSHGYGYAIGAVPLSGGQVDVPPEPRPLLAYWGVPCRGRPPACRCPAGRAVCGLLGGKLRWYCQYPFERCNGQDDNCDGRIDEGGDTLCNDNLACTTDRCVAGIGCSYTFGHSTCDDHIRCTEDQCAPSDAMHDERGCVSRPRDTDCNDGCDCSGQEVCAPTRMGADSMTGCFAGNPPCQNGGDLCTVSPCCEFMSTTCRARFTPDQAARIDLYCATAGGYAVPVAGTRRQVRCPQRQPRVCEDGNPCTWNECNPSTGCSFPARDTAPQPFEQGCTVRMCTGGALRTVTVRDANDARLRRLPSPTCGNAPDYRRCWQYECISGLCVPNGDAAKCDDGAFCNGQERCFAGNTQQLPGLRIGCFRTGYPVCGDPDTYCDERIDECKPIGSGFTSPESDF